MAQVYQRTAVLFLAVVLIAGCSSRHSTATVTDLRHYKEVGIASWYGKKYQGRPTASGEKFDVKKMTAAHRTLPFGTVVRVTNLDNGRKVEVKINDRGPFVEGRIIDLSRGAARKLNMKQSGLARVRIEVVR